MVEKEVDALKLLRDNRPQNQHQRQAEKARSDNAEKDALHHDQAGERIEQVVIGRKPLGSQTRILQHHQNSLHKGNHHEAVGGQREDKMPAEGKRPVGGRHHLSLEENRKKSAKGCGNQDDAEKGMNAVHPRFNQECHDRKEEHHGDGIPEPEVHGFGREHLLSDGIPVKNETEKHGPAQKAGSQIRWR